MKNEKQEVYCKNNTLSDKKNNKSVPWRPKKVRSLKLADSFKRLGYDKKSARVRFCGSALAFLENVSTGEKKLYSADFCKERLCPMCQWRKSLKVFHQVSKVMDRTQEEHKNLVPLFLTLTMQNCTDGELKEKITDIFQSWNRLLAHRKIKRIVQGWFRALEITYNKEKDTFHPHIHAVILVDKSYFKKDNKDYMQTSDWVQMWRTAMKLDYDPICDIRKVNRTKGKYKAVAEVAKYTLKDTEFITNDDELTDKLVEVLSTSLRGRRLYAFGGILKQIAKQIGIEELAEGDLIHIDDEKIRDDIATALVLYRWNFGLSNYIKE